MFYFEKSNTQQRKSDLLKDYKKGRSFPHNSCTTAAQTGAVNMDLSTGAGVLGRRGVFKNMLKNNGMTR